MDSYRIPTKSGASEYVDKRSRFLGLVRPVGSEDEARTIIAACKKQYHDARHNCWCYLLRDGTERYSDDGDPDGKTEYVGSRKPLPIDDRTPSIKSLTFKDINAKNCHVAGAYIFGLPESKVEKLTFENINFSYAKDAKPGVAAMMLGCDEASRQGLIVSNVEKLILKNVNIEGCDGEAIVADNVDKIERD